MLLGHVRGFLLVHVCLTLHTSMIGSGTKICATEGSQGQRGHGEDQRTLDRASKSRQSHSEIFLSLYCESNTTPNIEQVLSFSPFFYP